MKGQGITKVRGIEMSEPNFMTIHLLPKSNHYFWLNELTVAPYHFFSNVFVLFLSYLLCSSYAKAFDPDNWFTIDEETAEIKINKVPDRESSFLVNGTYIAKILAITKGNTICTL